MSNKTKRTIGQVAATVFFETMIVMCIPVLWGNGLLSIVVFFNIFNPAYWWQAVVSFVVLWVAWSGAMGWHNSKVFEFSAEYNFSYDNWIKRHPEEHEMNLVAGTVILLVADIICGLLYLLT